MLFVLGFIFMVLFFAFIGIFSGAAAIFIDFPSAILILAAVIFFLLTTKSGKVLGGYFKSSFKKDHSYTRAELESISAAVKNTVKFILAAGFFGFLAGLIAALAYVGAPEKIGPNLAISLLSITYAISTGFFVFFPAQAWAENRLNQLNS